MNKKDQKIGKILGIGISSTTIPEVLKRVVSDIRLEKKVLIVTPNPEIFVKAGEDSTLFSILNNANVAIPDGVGLTVAYKFLSLPNPKDKLERLVTLFVQGLGVGFSVIGNRKWLTEDLKPIKGRELATALINVASENDLKVFFLGGEGKEASQARLKVKKEYPSLKIESFHGPLLNSDGTAVNEKEEVVQKESVKRINEFSPDILLVGMTTPRQEKWLYRWLPKVNAKVGITVGGTFKYLYSERSVPPSWVNENGLEWLYRLLTGSQNIRRVGNAIWKFPLKVFWYKFNL
jgi:N-acetylglucosaminyldiphosphoundecaprenol N-acetyl-beta-D-mannosaminyltransferase